MKPRLVVVGCGMAAARTLEHLVELAPDRYAITVIGAEPLPAYNRILLSPVLAGELSRDELVLQDERWYAAHRIELRVGVTVATIDRVRRRVALDDGRWVAYDRLLLATGSTPVRLPVPGADLHGVLTYRDLQDTESMIAATRRGGRAVVVGGGLLGLEAANGLRVRGMDVDVVHLMPWLMERQLDAEAAAIVQKRLEAKGIGFHLSHTTQSLDGIDGRVVAVRMRDAAGTASTLPADLVVMAAGIRPNTSIAQACGLHCDRGIVVDDTMQTFDPRIYAVGECVRHRGLSYGLVQPLNEMAKVCAIHLAGVGSHYYAGSTASTHLKVTGVDVFSAGDFADAPGRESVVVRDRGANVYRRLVIEAGRLVGSLLVGDSRGAARFAELIRTRAPVDPMRGELMFLR